tara:strand:+ start:2696 stop:3604 length:909 start_codon:yes stop_codon:yes gene_type:complete
MKKLIILTDKNGWHCRQLKNSAEKRGFDVYVEDLKNLSLHIENNDHHVLDSKNQKIAFSNIFVRYVPGGSLEEIVHYLNILRSLRLNGCNVINTATQIEKTVDKSLTSLILRDNNISTPDTWVLRGDDQLYEKVDKLLKKNILIYKPLFGSQGENIVKIKNIDDLKKIDNSTNIYYLQKFIETKPSHDYRVLVISNTKNRKMYSMARYGKTFINNVSAGGECTPIALGKEIIEKSIQVSKLFQIPFCGIDLIKEREKIYVIEINSVPAWRGLQSITKDNISESITDILFKSITQKKQMQLKN